MLVRLLGEGAEEREPYAEGDTLVGPAVANALQVLGHNITNSSNATDVCCHLREAGANVSDLWPWDCHDVHLCAVQVGFQLPLWAKVLIGFLGFLSALGAGTVWYIRWDFARGLAIKQASLTGVGLRSPSGRPKTTKTTKTKKRRHPPSAGTVIKAPDSSGAGESLAKQSRAAVSGRSGASQQGNGKPSLPSDLGGAMEWSARNEETHHAEKAVAADGIAVRSSQGAKGSEPEPEPEPAPPVGWGKLDGWQAYPAQQHIFKGRVQDLKEQVRFMSADADRLRIRLGGPAYPTGMIDGQDKLLESYADVAKAVERQLKRRMRQIEQNCGVEVSGAQLDICRRRACTQMKICLAPC